MKILILDEKSILINPIFQLSQKQEIIFPLNTAERNLIDKVVNLPILMRNSAFSKLYKLCKS